MKSLSHYVEAAQTAAFEKHGAFFAFNGDQLRRSAKPNVDYVGLGAGLIAPKENADALTADLEKIHQEGIKRDVAENGIDAIIRRELWNHEVFYTWNFNDAADALAIYGIKREQVRAVFNKMIEEGAADDM